MNYKISSLIFLSILTFSCKNDKKVQHEETVTSTYKNKGHELVSKTIEKVGDYKTLRNKKDVVYTYTYQTPDGKTDITTEKYIFDGELSYGKYEKHQRTLSNFDGPIEQGYNGKEYCLKHNGNIIEDSVALKRVAFNRPTNFYWFTMFQKLTVMKNNDRKKGHGVRRDTNRSKNRPDSGKIINKTLILFEKHVKVVFSCFKDKPPML